MGNVCSCGDDSDIKVHKSSIVPRPPVRSQAQPQSAKNPSGGTAFTEVRPRTESVLRSLKAIFSPDGTYVEAISDGATQDGLYMALMYELLLQHCTRLREKFKSLDTGQTGYLSRDDVAQLLETMNEEPNEQELDGWVRQFQMDNEEKIAWKTVQQDDKFSESVPTQALTNATDANAGALRLLFEAQKPDEQDRIDKAGLRNLLRAHCRPSRDEALSELLGLAEMHGDKDKLSLEEYLKLALRLREKANKRQRRISGATSSETIDSLAGQERDAIQKEFRELDRSGNGTISRDDLSRLLINHMNGEQASQTSIDQVVASMLQDLGVPSGEGITLEMYEDLLCDIKYEFLITKEPKLKSTFESERTGSPQRCDRVTSAASDHPQEGPQMPVADALEKKIMTNVAMIETEDENYDNWTLTKTDNGPKDKKTGQKSQDINKGAIQLWTREISGSNQLGVKVVTSMPLTKEQIFDKLIDPTTKFTSGGHWEVIEDLGNGRSITWSSVSIPFCTNSDFCNGEYMGDYNGSMLYTYIGVDYPTCPPKSGYIRGEMLLGGWRITPIEGLNRCRVTCINVCDPCRNVPKMLAQSGANQSMQSMASLKSLLKGAQKTKKK